MENLPALGDPNWKTQRAISQECIDRVIQEGAADLEEALDSEESSEEHFQETVEEEEAADEETLKDTPAEDFKAVVEIQDNPLEEEPESVESSRSDVSLSKRHRFQEVDSLLRSLKIRVNTAERSAVERYMKDISSAEIHPIAAFVDGMRVRQTFDQAAYNDSLNGFKEVAARLGKATASIENATRDQAAHTLKVLREVKELQANMKEWGRSSSTSSAALSTGQLDAPTPPAKFRLPQLQPSPTSTPEKGGTSTMTQSKVAQLPPKVVPLTDIYSHLKTVAGDAQRRDKEKEHQEVKEQEREVVDDVNRKLQHTGRNIPNDPEQRWNSAVEIFQAADISVEEYLQEYGSDMLIEVISLLDLPEITVRSAMTKYKNSAGLSKAIWDNTDDLIASYE
ncbi:TPA_asm: protein 2 [Didymochlaena virus 1]|uniref:Protein 2 n=1 Tax=Didymochlaena virus 1 TaxID=2977966 RepID=A0A9N6YJ14_9RHAB|nr:TPA_asm: protein 2 [Didymochlaena virus 1]